MAFSQGLVKVHGPDDLRTELKDVSVFRMDVHVPPVPTPAAGHPVRDPPRLLG